MLDFNLKYPKNPQTLGEKIRKARIDRGLFIRELASQIGVTEDTVINWEARGIRPTEENIKRIKDFIGI